MSTEGYWYEEGAYAYKAGIEFPDLEQHFPSNTMTLSEWHSLKSGWVSKQYEYFEQMGQGRLFS